MTVPFVLALVAVLLAGIPFVLSVKQPCGRVFIASTTVWPGFFYWSTMASQG